MADDLACSYETYREYTPVQATVRWLPAPVAGVAINVVFALLASRVSAQYLIIFGGIGTGVRCQIILNDVFVLIIDVCFFSVGTTSFRCTRP